MLMSVTAFNLFSADIDPVGNKAGEEGDWDLALRLQIEETVNLSRSGAVGAAAPAAAAATPAASSYGAAAGDEGLEEALKVSLAEVVGTAAAAATPAALTEGDLYAINSRTVKPIMTQEDAGVAFINCMIEEGAISRKSLQNSGHEKYESSIELLANYFLANEFQRVSIDKYPGSDDTYKILKKSFETDQAACVDWVRDIIEESFVGQDSAAAPAAGASAAEGYDLPGTPPMDSRRRSFPPREGVVLAAAGENDSAITPERQEQFAKTLKDIKAMRAEVERQMEADQAAQPAAAAATVAAQAAGSALLERMAEPRQPDKTIKWFIPAPKVGSQRLGGGHLSEREARLAHLERLTRGSAQSRELQSAHAAAASAAVGLDQQEGEGRVLTTQPGEVKIITIALRPRLSAVLKLASEKIGIDTDSESLRIPHTDDFNYAVNSICDLIMQEENKDARWIKELHKHGRDNGRESLYHSLYKAFEEKAATNQ